MEKWTNDGQESKLQQIKAELAGMTQDAFNEGVGVDFILHKLATIQAAILGMSVGYSKIKFNGFNGDAEAYAEIKNQLYALTVCCRNAADLIRNAAAYIARSEGREGRE